VFHLLQLLLKILLKAEGELPENSRLASSFFIGGAWLLLVTQLFPHQLGPWREWCLWAGWICVGLATFMFVRRKIRNWQGKGTKRRSSMLSR
jgi:hypothetical protein